MEVIAAASSIAGLVSLAGQCLTGARNLYSFYGYLADASKTAKSFLKDINSLIRTLLEVSELLDKIEAYHGHLTDQIALASLQLQLEDCDVLLASWLRTAESRNVTGATGLKSRFRKFWSAVNKQSVDNARSEMQRHRLEIVVALSTLGRAFDLQILQATQRIGTNVLETKVSAQVLLGASNDTQDAIQRLEVPSATISDEIGSMKSLMTSLSSMSVRSLDLRPDSPYSMEGATWRCDAWISIDDLFWLGGPLVDGTKVLECGLCGHTFLEDNPSQRHIRIEHLKITHRLMYCSESAKNFTDLKLFYRHLKIFHNAALGALWTDGLRDAYRVRSGWTGAREQYTSLAPPQDEGSQASDKVYSYPWDEDSDEDDDTKHSLIGGSWDATLLGEFTSPHDRINRWLLHVLGSDTDHAKLHREFCEFYTLVNADGTKTPYRLWHRLTLKHWFTDEAALGIDINAISDDADDADLKLVNSSLNLSARPSVSEVQHVPSKDLDAIYRDANRRQMTTRAMARDYLAQQRSAIDLHKKASAGLERMPTYKGTAPRCGGGSRAGSSMGSSIGSIDERLQGYSGARQASQERNQSEFSAIVTGSSDGDKDVARHNEDDISSFISQLENYRDIKFYAPEEGAREHAVILTKYSRMRDISL